MDSLINKNWRHPGNNQQAQVEQDRLPRKNNQKPLDNEDCQRNMLEIEASRRPVGETTLETFNNTRNKWLKINEHVVKRIRLIFNNEIFKAEKKK